MTEQPNIENSKADDEFQINNSQEEPEVANPDIKEKINVESSSKENGLKSAEKVFKNKRKNESDNENRNENEDKEFYENLTEFAKKFKDLGLDNFFTTKIYYGGIHIKDSNVENHGNVVGNNQTNNSKPEINLSPEEVIERSTDNNIDSIESIFDNCSSIKQRSFMIAIATLNGCNYRTVVEASQKLNSILKPPEEKQTES